MQKFSLFEFCIDFDFNEYWFSVGVFSSNHTGRGSALFSIYWDGVLYGDILYVSTLLNLFGK